jgi:hypothetical protein
MTMFRNEHGLAAASKRQPQSHYNAVFFSPLYFSPPLLLLESSPLDIHEKETNGKRNFASTVFSPRQKEEATDPTEKKKQKKNKNKT